MRAWPTTSGTISPGRSWFRQLQSEAPAAVDPDRLSLILGLQPWPNRLLPPLQLLLPLLGPGATTVVRQRADAIRQSLF